MGYRVEPPGIEIPGYRQSPLPGALQTGLWESRMGRPWVARDFNPGRLYVCNTPVLNSGISGFIAAHASDQPITFRVSAGSMIASTQRRAAA